MNFGRLVSRIHTRCRRCASRLASPLHYLTSDYSKLSTDINYGFRNINIGTRYYSTEGSASNPQSDSSEDIIIKVENGVRSITFNRPEKKNAINFKMAFAMTQALIESNDDENTNIVVLRGTKDYFTSGMDLSSPYPKKPESTNVQQEKPPAESSEKPKRKSGFFIFAKSLISCEKPLIALVNGPAVGFGVTMLGLCDTVYCSDSATFKTRFTEYGVPPELCSTYIFPGTMGYVKANNVLLFNNKINAEEAYKAGLVSRIFPHASFQDDAWKLVQAYAQLPLKSLMYSKELIRGRERQLYYQVNANEQDKFDPEVAKEVKRKWMEKQKQV